MAQFPLTTAQTLKTGYLIKALLFSTITLVADGILLSHNGGGAYLHWLLVGYIARVLTVLFVFKYRSIQTLRIVSVLAMVNGAVMMLLVMFGRYSAAS